MAETPRQDEFYATVDRETADERERQSSKVLYEALKSRRDDVGGASRIPADDRQLSETILAEARKRSAQISAGTRRSTQVLATPTRPIPAWLIIAWLAAIAAVITALTVF
ncbi:MAG TPA: hypothetical protein VEL07_07210 [Planctomycetota bacterium]|nr:hypothetical protein [Planctomycetota bacterium]